MRHAPLAAVLFALVAFAPRAHAEDYAPAIETLASTLEARFVDPATGRPDRQGFGRVSADGRSIDSMAMMGIRRLTWLVISLPGGGA